MSNSPEIPVRHVPAGNCYRAVVDGHESRLDYVISGQQITFTHTFVPPELRGRGLAEKLVRAALADARTKHLQVVPACSYVAAFIERHREYGDLVSP